MSLEAYLDPENCPAERPRLEDMHASTAALHDGIDRAIRSSGTPYLHPEGKTLQLAQLGLQALHLAPGGSHLGANPGGGGRRRYR